MSNQKGKVREVLKGILLCLAIGWIFSSLAMMIWIELSILLKGSIEFRKISLLSNILTIFNFNGFYEPNFIIIFTELVISLFSIFYFFTIIKSTIEKRYSLKNEKK